SLIWAFNCSLICLRVLYTVKISAMAFCILMSGIGIWMFCISLQSKVSLADPQELKRAYLSNSGLVRKSIKYSGIRKSRFVPNTIEIDDTRNGSAVLLKHREILSTLREVSGT